MEVNQAQILRSLSVSYVCVQACVSMIFSKTHLKSSFSHTYIHMVKSNLHIDYFNWLNMIGGEEWDLQYFPAPLFGILVSPHVQTPSSHALFPGIPETHSNSFAEIFNHLSCSWTVVMTAAARWRIEKLFMASLPSALGHTICRCWNLIWVEE